MATNRARVPPGPDGLPLVGHTLQLSRDVFGFYERLHADYGDVVRYEVNGDEGYIVAHPDLVEQVLVTDDAAFVKGDLLQRTLSSALGEGMLLAEGDDWRGQRTTAQPAFYRERVAAYGETMTAFAGDVAEGWTDGAVVDVRPAMSELTLRILGRTLFGLDIRGRESVVRDTAEALRTRTDPSSLTAFLPDWVPAPSVRAYRRAIEDARDLVDDLIAQRRAEREEATATSADEAVSRFAGGDDLLTMLVAAADAGGMDDATLRDNMLTFLFAGHETSALAVTYALFCLGHHPEAQARVHADLDALDAPPTADDVDDLPHLDRAVREAMRLYPPVYTHFREPVRDVTVGDYLIPEGSVVSLPQWLVHRDERWYDDPLAFAPERWVDWDGPEYAYFPFSGGPRHCIGMRFAELEIRLVLGTLLREWRVESLTDRPLDLDAAANTTPTDPVELRLHAR
ncbi:cytochrome P450 [Halomarina rubra]|uniref:Cytochrome P450 n=1 Tax=Halomarina rubra TaxID=2071873 RepID=A0ABD6AW17_9EURY|nr:cytochrome P450 [Halomarina rubra]